jgi:hypothetical protein
MSDSRLQGFCCNGSLRLSHFQKTRVIFLRISIFVRELAIFARIFSSNKNYAFLGEIKPI